MEPRHYFMLLIVLIAGYALGRYVPTLGQKVGMP